MRRIRLNPRVVIFAWGNETRGDDGLGPRLASRIAAAGWAHVTLIEEFQLQVEHALDLVGQDIALFIDAGHHTPGPFVFSQVSARRVVPYLSHGAPPEAVLEAYRQVMNDEPPPAFVLCLRGEDFALQEGLSPAARAHLAAAWGFVIPLLSWPQLDRWTAAQTGDAEAIGLGVGLAQRPAAE